MASVSAPPPCSVHSPFSAARPKITIGRVSCKYWFRTLFHLPYADGPHDETAALGSKRSLSGPWLLVKTRSFRNTDIPPSTIPGSG